MAEKNTIFLYTDGAASGNPGPGGWGAVLKCGDLRREMSGGFACTTNNRMELLAVIMGLEAIKWDNADVEVWSDSTYVVKAVEEKWLESWVATNFKKKKNRDLWVPSPLSQTQGEVPLAQGARGTPRERALRPTGGSRIFFRRGSAGRHRIFSLSGRAKRRNIGIGFLNTIICQTENL